MSFDVEFERDILTAAAHDSDFRKNVRRVIATEADPWTTEAHRLLWDVIRKLGDADTLTSSIVAKAIRAEPDDDIAEAAALVGKKVLKGRTTAPHYAIEELQFWTRKTSITRVIGDVVQDLKVGDVDEAEKRIAKLSRSTNRIVQDAYGDWYRGWEDRQARRLEEKEDPTLRPSIRTYLPRLDKVLGGGLTIEQFGLIVAHTNVGKSTLALNFAFAAALQEIPTVYVSTEMAKELVDTRIDSRFFDRPTEDFAKHNFTKTDLKRFQDKRERLKERLDGHLLTAATPMNTLTKSMIEGYMDEAEQNAGEKCEMIVVDSGDHMVPEMFIKEKRLQQIAVYWDLKELVGTRKCACWSTAHASGDHKALLTEFDTAESKDKSKIASVVLTLNQTQKERADDRLRLYVAKNRTGTKGTIIDLLANYGKSMFEEEPFEEGEE